MALLRVLARSTDNPAAYRRAVGEGGLVWKAHHRLASGIGLNKPYVKTFRSADGSQFVGVREQTGDLEIWNTATGEHVGDLFRDSPSAHGERLFLGLSPAGSYALFFDCAPGSGDTPCSTIVGGGRRSWRLDGSPNRAQVRMVDTEAGTDVAVWGQQDLGSGRRVLAALDSLEHHNAGYLVAVKATASRAT